jgi:hypothetical protein
MIDYLISLLGLDEYEPKPHEPEVSSRWRRELARAEGLVDVQPPPAQSDTYVKDGPPCMLSGLGVDRTKTN